MNKEESEAIERANRLAQELLDRDWLEQGVSRQELDQSRVLEKQFNADLDAGCSADEVLQRWEGATPSKIHKRKTTSLSSPPQKTVPRPSQK
jgi:hypothetical protein